MFKNIVLLDDGRGHGVPTAWSERFGVILREHWQDVKKDEVVICSGDLTHNHVRYWLNTNQPAIYMARGYIGNHLYKHRLFWRATINGWANLQMMPIPYNRWHLTRLPYDPAKSVNEVRNVLIAPSKGTTTFWTQQNNNQWVESILPEYHDKITKIRPKAGKPGLRWKTLWDDLNWADLVVSQSSAITVEAAWYGCQTASQKPCPTWLLTDANRADWLEHIAWSQFTNDEWASGDAIELIFKYFGDPREYPSLYTYNFNC